MSSAVALVCCGRSLRPRLMGDGVELLVSTGHLRQQRLDRALPSSTRTAMSSRSLGVGRSPLEEKYVLGGERSPRSVRLRVHHVRQRRRAGGAPQKLSMDASNAICSAIASLSRRMRAASASLTAHSRTDA